MDTVSESSMAVSMAASEASPSSTTTTPRPTSTPSSAPPSPAASPSHPTPSSNPLGFHRFRDDFTSSPCVSSPERGLQVRAFRACFEVEVGLGLGIVWRAAAGSSRYDFDQAANFSARNAVDRAPLVGGEDGEVVHVLSAEDVERIRGFRLGLPSLGADGRRFPALSLSPLPLTEISLPNPKSLFAR
ncbi:hypothetical protein Scep_009647 [Stephania cephalantha]|uniref:Uncharacterized protein n=1 Tax=Stephania cephalantha TaxID=152367 RepID=A0AAP0JU09_9MAGN